VLNKIDLLSPQERALLEFRFPEAVFTSLTQNLGLETLKSALLRYMEKTRVVLELALPLERVDLVRLLHHQALILSENYQETMVEIRALCPPALKGKLQHYLVYREEV
jgi:GTP-binding protein HflX